MHQLSWIGLGRIGQAICENIALYGPGETEVIVWNRTTQKATELADRCENLTAVSSIEDAVSQSSIICLCVKDDAAVEEILGIVAGTVSLVGKLFVDLSTIHPKTAATQSKMLKAFGAGYLASPIFGGVGLARKQQITLVIAGTSDAIAKFAPYTIGITCQKTICLFDKPCEQAFMLKLLGNFFRFSAIATLGEMATLSDLVGLPPDALDQLVQLVLQGPAIDHLQSLRAGEYHKLAKPMAEISLWNKESTHLMDIVSKCGARLEVLDTLCRQGQRVELSHGSTANLLAIFGLIREQCGLPFEISE